MNRKFMLAGLLLLAISASFASAQVSISDLGVSKAVISSGQSGSISFVITNTGDRDLSKVTVRLSSSLNLGQTAFTYDDLDQKESRLISTSYSSPNSMKSGSYPIKIDIEYTYNDEKFQSQSGVVVNVVGSKYLVVSNFTTDLKIGKTTPFVLRVKNEGNDDLNDVLLNLVMPDGFVPLGGSQFYISSLAVGEEKAISTDVFVEKSIEPNPFQFRLIKLADGYNATDVLNVYATGTPKLSFSGINLDPKIPKEGETESISVQLENTGSGDAYNVIARLELDQDVKGITTEYLGSLDRDDLTSAIFDIRVPHTDVLSGKVNVTYTDGKGNSYSISQNVRFDVLPKKSSSALTFAVAGLAVAGAIYYLKQKGKKR